MVSKWLPVAVAFTALTAHGHSAEIEFRHINDQYASVPIEDDLYTGTLEISASVAAWTIGLDEYLFTDKVNGLRFDETYLTVARDLLGADSEWQVRARVGAVRVGQGLYGQRFQNFIHSILNQEDLNLPYVPGSESYVFARLNVSRSLYANERVTVAPLVEIESAGFKKHARVALGARRNLSAGFALHAEAGVRFSDTSFAPLVPWIEENDPTFAVGVDFKNFLDLTWTSNYFGTGEYHWHISARAKFGAGAKKQDQAGTAVSNTPFAPPNPLAR